jgi:hypothetical protein
MGGAGVGTLVPSVWSHDAADYETVPRYLSLEWIDALTTEVESNASMADLAHRHVIGVTQIVTGGPEGDVIYHLQVGDGDARFGPGVASPEDIRFEQDWETAVAVATGMANAQECFINGRIRLTGDQQAIIDNGAVFAALDGVFNAVRVNTIYE